MEFTLQEVAACLGLAEASGRVITGWSIDSRTLAPGDLYFALKGDVHDGNDFLAGAFEKGAAAAVSDRTGPGILTVADPLQALQSLAQWARQKWGGTLVAVTGSAGKTSTKDAIAHLLSTAMRVGSTTGNFNNHIGLPLSILRIPDDAPLAVLEMGMNHAGEIARLASIARPDLGVVTNVGYAHIEFFDSIDGIALAKRELIEALGPDGIAVLNADDERVVRFRNVHSGPTVTYGFDRDADVRAELIGPGHFRCLGAGFETQFAGRHAISNVVAAIAVAKLFGIAPESLVEAVRSLTPGKMRGQRFTVNGIGVIDDCYNSNPAAVRAMIDMLAATPASRRIAVLGEMKELGDRAPALHREAGQYAADAGIDLIIAVHGAARFLAEGALAQGIAQDSVLFFDDAQTAGQALQRIAQPGDVILFKGSRGVHVERALEAFTATIGSAA